ncbi:MAG: alpha/beta fold hydrolase, partial [Rhizobiaceae bacterium]
MTPRLKVRTDPGQGTPLVLLHGFGGAGEDWAGIAEALAGAALIIPDLPGHGGSMTYPEAGPPKVAGNAVLAELDAAGHARVHLAGHSMGGAIATLIALAAPDRVASLTLFAPGGFGPEINHRLLTRYTRAAETDTMRAVLEGMTGYRYAVPDELVAQKLAQHAMPGQRPLLQALAADMVRDGRQGT